MLVGCGTPDRSTAAPASAEAQPEDSAATDAAPWSSDALAAQPRLEQLRRSVPEGLGYTPGTTAWRDAQLDLPDALTSAASAAQAPGALLTSVIAAAGWLDAVGEDVWEATMRIGREDDASALAVVLLWGLRDDAVAGHDFRVHMARGPNGWYVTGIEERFHCSRGVDPGGLCL